ncbi:hypothetical protein A0H76_2410 [Hepatospora eriocheir]|uniref:Uncharacterized protein n=2 Tax=Hepatospora eriocheir TaxID=1081669 RepID=A0A1X0QFD6_9MICR|nr:hypothetical protein A0H76_2410 [Hepatospora eriocheir]
MTVRALNLITKEINYPITILKNKKLAIDGAWFVRKFFKEMNKANFDDIPMYVKNELENIIKISKEFQIDILWIWDGMKYNDFTLFEDKLHSSEHASRLITNNKLKPYHMSSIEFLIKPVNKVLNDAKITVVRAPYSAMAQCVYYLENNIVDYIFSKTDVFLFNRCEKGIFDFNFETKKINYVLRSTIENYLKVKNHFFLRQILIASGCEFCKTVPSLAENFSVEKLIELFAEKSYKNSSFEEKLKANPDYKELHTAAIINIMFHPVMTQDGTVVSMEHKEMPEDMPLIFGEKLPNSLYWLLFTNQISPVLIENMAYKPADSILTIMADKLRSIVLNEVNIDELKSDTDNFAINLDRIISSKTIPEINNQFKDEIIKNYTVLSQIKDGSTIAIKTLNNMIFNSGIDKEIFYYYFMLFDYYSAFDDLIFILKITAKISDVPSNKIFIENGNLKENEIADKFLQIISENK